MASRYIKNGPYSPPVPTGVLGPELFLGRLGLENGFPLLTLLLPPPSTMTSLPDPPVIVAPAVPVETVKLVEEVPPFIVVMEFGKAPIKDSVPEPSILIVEIDAPEFSKTTKLSLALVIFKFVTFVPAISIKTFSLVVLIYLFYRYFINLLIINEASGIPTYFNELLNFELNFYMIFGIFSGLKFLTIFYYHQKSSQQFLFF